MGDKEGGCADFELMPESGIPAVQKRLTYTFAHNHTDSYMTSGFL